MGSTVMVESEARTRTFRTIAICPPPRSRRPFHGFKRLRVSETPGRPAGPRAYGMSVVPG